MNEIRIRRLDVNFLPQSSRVIIRPFIPAEDSKRTAIIERALHLTEEEIASELKLVEREFDERHYHIESVFLANFARIQHYVPPQPQLSNERKLLIGALFSGEYSLESAALFNPSIVPHPDQEEVPQGGIRFILSLRATGEGHISSIEFRTGILSAGGRISLDPVSRFVTAPDVVVNPSYRKKSFIIKLREMGFIDGYATTAMESLEDYFTRSDLNRSVESVRDGARGASQDLNRALECIQWLADSNYELQFSMKLAMSERIIFPVSANETNGIEDARFVRFVEKDGFVRYYATYTAYNGHAILPQLIETDDFLHFRILTLNGNAVQNKGMALFPRRIRGKYFMLSRQDDENLSIMSSENPHFWNDPKIILRPRQIWEAVKIGNCGSPIETEAGWLVITHGVGPMRKYCISAALLDLDNPSKVIGRLAKPLLSPESHEREGYVPNVVYSCGSMLHGRELILPFAVSDHSSAIASVSLDDLLAALLANP